MWDSKVLRQVDSSEGNIYEDGENVLINLNSYFFIWYEKVI
jgi:hypothetical protein